uniref:Methyltransferase FkbM domain-containing protein n=1 Tax=Ditylenchus dipsaci TaxID=166011 RepID=A0A915DB20_9BILA
MKSGTELITVPDSLNRMFHLNFFQFYEEKQNTTRNLLPYKKNGSLIELIERDALQSISLHFRQRTYSNSSFKNPTKNVSASSQPANRRVCLTETVEFKNALHLQKRGMEFNREPETHEIDYKASWSRVKQHFNDIWSDLKSKMRLLSFYSDGEEVKYFAQFVKADDECNVITLEDFTMKHKTIEYMGIADFFHKYNGNRAIDLLLVDVEGSEYGILNQFVVCLLLLSTLKVNAQSFRKVHLGFPEAWDGDKYQELHCPSKDIPKFLDGYFLCQLSAAYGNVKAPPGQRLNHMIDAIGAVGAFHISNGEVTFSAQYYPSRPYKIWEFYDRNMTKASVPWAGWSDYNLTAMAKWEQIPNNADSARFHPNLDFWRVGNKLIAGTEAPYWVGYEFDVRTLGKFKLFPFTEDNEIFGNPRPNMIPISMAIHERTDSTGTIWGSFSAMNFNDQRFYQGIFTVDSTGVRRVVGMYDYGVWDADACSKDDEYIGDKTQLPGYIHSITSTENYIILPVTSLLINPCKFKEPPLSNPHSSIQNGGLWGMDFFEQVPARFITHQLNAYESLEGNIIADMIVYDSHDPYVKYFYTDFLTSQETIAADFPQTNHAFDGQVYQWAYLVDHPFAADNSILKINVDDPAGGRNLRFKADPSFVLHEPWVVSRPNAVGEDDAVLIIRALDLAENKGVLLIVDASTMLEVGRANVPISVPFGFHNRFFSSKELGLTSTFVEEPSSNGFRSNSLDRSSAINNHIRGKLNKNRKPHSWKPLVQQPQPSLTGSTTSAFWSRMLMTTTPPGPTWVPIHPIAKTSIPWWMTTTPSAPDPIPTIPPYIQPEKLRPPPHSRPYSSRLGRPMPMPTNTAGLPEPEEYVLGGERTIQTGDTLTVRQLYEKMLKRFAAGCLKFLKMSLLMDALMVVTRLSNGQEDIVQLAPVISQHHETMG